MNEFEQALIDKLLEGLHKLEVSFTKELGQLRTEIHAATVENQALREKIERSIETDTHRLNTHSREIDELNKRAATLEEWKSQFEKQVAHRMTLSNSISAIAAVILAFLLSKFFNGIS